MERLILHVDVNNAFLSWSAVDMLEHGYQADIRNRFAVIGGEEKMRKGVVLAKSMAAKRMGIVTGESLYSARKKCPSLEVYPPNFAVYKKYSNLMYEYLCKYSPSIERYSIDECFIDYTGCEKIFGKVRDVANKIKEDIKNNLGFTVNVGIGNNKLLAKMASDFAKPDLVHTLFLEEIEAKMWPLDVSNLFMIGRMTNVKLHEMGIKTIFDLAHANKELLLRKFKKFGIVMYEYANGIDDSLVAMKEGQKSISVSSTLPNDTSDLNQLEKLMRNLSFELGIKLRKDNGYTDSLYLMIKYANFVKISKQKKLKKRINTDNDLYNNFLDIFNSIWNYDRVRSIAVGVNNILKENSVQLNLFESVSKVDNDMKMQKAVDYLRDKFGSDKIIYGDMLKK